MGETMDAVSLMLFTRRTVKRENKKGKRNASPKNYPIFETLEHRYQFVVRVSVGTVAGLEV